MGLSEGVRQGVRRCALRCVNAVAANPQLASALRQAGVVETLQVNAPALSEQPALEGLASLRIDSKCAAVAANATVAFH